MRYVRYRNEKERDIQDKTALVVLGALWLQLSAPPRASIVQGSSLFPCYFLSETYLRYFYPQILYSYYISLS